jgi:arylsulfatase A-like enzyme
MNRREFLGLTAAGVLTARTSGDNEPPKQPNIVIIYVDDMGYGDLSCYGSCISTPNIDRLAKEGTRFTHYYSASPVCSPSRAALMTGRYPVRVGIPNVLSPEDVYGLPASEVTLAELLKTVHYNTICIGKWHLGSEPQFLPINRGFDEFFGLPYSNDQLPSVLMHNNDIIEEPVNLDNLTQRYTQHALDFIGRSTDAPFFLYLPHTFPHIPLAVSPAFKGRSGLGMYGDVIQEIDWSTGQVLQALRDNNLDQQTLVIFSSDNGPWFQGSPGILRGRKGETWDGGMRMPMIARLPGIIPAGSVCTGMSSAMDIFPTIAALTGATLPSTIIDGVNIWPMLTGNQSEVARDVFLFMNGWDIQCARWGGWKLHVARNNSAAWSPAPASGVKNLPLPRPELYNLVVDVTESYEMAENQPQVVAEIRARMEKLIATMPQHIQDTWKATMQLQVYDTPAGSLPVEAQ